MAKKKRSSRQKPYWERSYKGHAYWLGKAMLGKVTLSGKGRYGWEAAGRTGATESLDKAKAAVELAVALANRQLPLFE
ncbi:MAG TPA: hypothetical protein VKP89_05685 [Burkholderiales bacterium]|nr:hypothetical protein [Burkholderiales bacterium]